MCSFLTILIYIRKHHLGVNYVVTNLMSLGWLSLCEKQDTKRAKRRQGLNSMIMNGQSTDGGIITPLQKESNNSIGDLFSPMQVCRLHEAMMSRPVIFCVIVGQIGYAWFPVDEELTVDGAVADPVETHVDGFEALMFDGVI